jgi:prevent-host-death family protein
MPIVNMLRAKSQLSRLVDAVESGAEKEIVIARNGKPAAKLVAVSSDARPKRIGLYDGVFPPMDVEAFDALDETIAAALVGSDE